MATKAKESTVVGKEKKAPSSNSHITITKSTPKPSRTTTNSTNKANSTPSESNIPNYLKPTRTIRLESSSSFKQPKSDTPNKPAVDRRRSFDKPLPSSNLTKQTQSSHLRLQKAFVSPGPRDRTVSRRSSIGSVIKSTNSPKPISDRTSNIPSDGKTKLLVTRNPKKSTPSLSTPSSTKKVANKGRVSGNSTKRTAAEITKTSNVDTEQVKEVTSQEVEVIKAKNEEQKHELEHVTDRKPDIDSEHEIEHAHGPENSDPAPDQVNDERVISTVSEAEEEEGEEEKEPHEEKAEDDEHELEEKNTNQDENNNNGNESDHQEEHSKIEGQIAVNEKEDEGGIIIKEDHKSENNNNEEMAVVEEEKAVEGVVEAEVEPTKSKQNLAANGQGTKKESLSNDVIEETASKLLEGRKNKVMALAGAFQTVIDYQTTSK